MATEIFTEKAPVPGYIYSAFSAMMLSPLGVMGTANAIFCWGVLQIALAFMLCFLPPLKLLRIPPHGKVLYFILFITSVPVLHNLKWGQLSIPVTLLVLFAFMLYQRKKHAQAGVLFALATGIKYYPAVFLVVFVVKRDVRFLMSFAVALVVFVCVIPAVALGPVDWLVFEQASGAAFTQHERVITFASNSQYLPHVVARLSAEIDPNTRGTALLLSQGIALLILLLNVALMWGSLRNGCAEDNKEGRIVPAGVLTFLSLPLILKTSWPHYFVYLPFCQTALLVETWRLTEGRGRAMHTGLILLSVLLSNVYVFVQFAGWQAYSEYGMLLLSDVLLLVSFYAMYGHRWRENLFQRSEPDCPDVYSG
jgi:hypothetical protein